MKLVMKRGEVTEATEKEQKRLLAKINQGIHVLAIDLSISSQNNGIPRQFYILALPAVLLSSPSPSPLSFESNSPLPLVEHSSIRRKCESLFINACGVSVSTILPLSNHTILS
jgi:hypothetical protein